MNEQSNGRRQSIIIYDNYMLLNVFLIENRLYCDKCQTIIINAHALLSMKQFNGCGIKRNTGTIERLIQGVSFYGVVKS